MQKLPAIILAAGLSSRMHAFKPLLPLAGKPLIQHVLDALERSHAIAPILVITGHNAPALGAALPVSVKAFQNPNYAAGEMLSSVRTGLDHLPADASAFLLAFADQPAVDSRTIAQLVAQFRVHHPPLVIPTFNGRRGHPVILSAALIPEIRALPPHDTLKSVTRRHRDRAALIPVNDPAILEDLDTPEDLARAAARLNA